MVWHERQTVLDFQNVKKNVDFRRHFWGASNPDLPMNALFRVSPSTDKELAIYQNRTSAGAAAKGLHEPLLIAGTD